MDSGSLKEQRPPTGWLPTFLSLILHYIFGATNFFGVQLVCNVGYKLKFNKVRAKWYEQNNVILRKRLSSNSRSTHPKVLPKQAFFCDPVANRRFH